MKLKVTSKVAEYARKEGYENIQQFALAAQMTWPMAKGIWRGDVKDKRIGSIAIAAKFLGVGLDEVITVEESNEQA